jgi:aspartate/tyrosine/aromatic aminotransferase
MLQEYLAIGGHPAFCKLARQLAFGSSSLPVSEGRVVTLQCISGTGSLRIGMLPCLQTLLLASVPCKAHTQAPYMVYS